MYVHRAIQKKLPVANTALLYLSSLPLLFECFELENCCVCFDQGKHCGAEGGIGVTAAAALVRTHLSHPCKEPHKTKFSISNFKSSVDGSHVPPEQMATMLLGLHML